MNTSPGGHSSPSPVHRRFLLGGIAGATGISALTAMARAGGGGPLNPPPGAVASSAKPLAEVEPRTAVNAFNTPGAASPNAVFAITQPGSYYLTANILVPAGAAGIVISASDVTVDLNGFSIIGNASNSGDGVLASGFLTNIALRNGTVRDLGGNGVYTPDATNCRFERLTVSACAGYGIRVGDNALVADCACPGNGSGAAGGGGPSAAGDGVFVGIGSIVRGCGIRGAGRHGIYHNGFGLVTDCFVSDALRPFSLGIGAAQQVLVRGCQVSVCTIGIRCNGRSRVEGCQVTSCTQAGIICDSGGGAKIIGNNVGLTGSSAGHAAIRIQSAGCSVEENRLEVNYRHIEVSSAGNFIARNFMAQAGGGGATTIAAGNAYGPIVAVTGAGNIAGTAGSDHPQANFVF